MFSLSELHAAKYKGDAEFKGLFLYRLSEGVRGIWIGMVQEGDS